MRPVAVVSSRSVPRRVRLGAFVVLLGALVLVGCSKPDGRYLTDAVDVERATRIWNDPWVAPDRTTAASGITDGLRTVSRDVASRTSVSLAAPEDAVLDEVRAAQAVGWELTGASCTTADVSTGRAEVSLKRSGDLDEAATARVIATSGALDPIPAQLAPLWHNDDAEPSTPGPGSASVVVSVVVQVPHHLDREWPDPPAVAVEDTCLGGTVPGVAAQVDHQHSRPLLAGGRLPGKATKPTHEVPAVPDDLLDAATADMVLLRLGLDLRSAYGQTGYSPRASFPRVTAATTLAETVGQAAAEGWSLTYTGCWASGLTVAELHRDLTGGYSAALRLQQEPNNADDPAQVTFFAAAAIASSDRGGPRPGDLEPVAVPCWEQAPADPAALPAFVWAGTPWFGPTVLGAVQP